MNFFTIKHDIIVYTNAQYFNVMRVAAEYVRKARGCDRFRLAPMRFARAVTPGSANGDARICEKRFLDRFFFTIHFFFFFFFYSTFSFFFPTFLFHVPVISPRIPYQYHIIPRQYTAYAVLPQRQQHSVSLPNSANS